MLGAPGMVSMELDDEDKIEAATEVAPNKPDWPWGLRITLTDKELVKLGLDPSDAEVGDTFHGCFEARITSTNSSQNEDGSTCCRIEAQIEALRIPTIEDDDSH